MQASGSVQFGNIDGNHKIPGDGSKPERGTVQDERRMQDNGVLPKVLDEWTFTDIQSGYKLAKFDIVLARGECQDSLYSRVLGLYCRATPQVSVEVCRLEFILQDTSLMVIMVYRERCCRH